MYSFSSDRRFVILSYENSHGLLLLSSKKEGNAIPTRIDILFKDVRAMDIRVFMDEIKITEVSVEMGSSFQSLPDKMAEPGLRLYLLNGGDWNG
jgi:hypothetical protein